MPKDIVFAKGNNPQGVEFSHTDTTTLTYKIPPVNLNALQADYWTGNGSILFGSTTDDGLARTLNAQVGREMYMGNVYRVGDYFSNLSDIFTAL